MPPPPPKDVQMESQTQDETQLEADYTLPRELDLKRKAVSTGHELDASSASTVRPTKKMKVSIAPPVDLAE